MTNEPSAPIAEVLVPHIGWLAFPRQDHVGVYLQQGWFEYRELAFLSRYLRPGDRVVDCGAHVGLYSVLASRLVGPGGRVLALEPNPPTVAILQRNLAANGADNVEMRPVALGAEPGHHRMAAAAGEHAAYSSFVNEVPDAHAIDVPVARGDELVLETLGPGRVAFFKIDVEGYEREVWQGCRSCVDRVDVVMVECSRDNLEPRGLKPADLFRVWEDDGFRFHRYDAGNNWLEPVTAPDDVAWENYFALRDTEGVQRRIDTAPASQERIAREIESRGRRAFELLKRACDAEHLLGLARADVERLRGELEQARSELEQARGELEQVTASVKEGAETRSREMAALSDALERASDRVAQLEPLAAWARDARSARLLARLGRLPVLPRE